MKAIKKLITEGSIEEALQKLNEAILEGRAPLDEAYYLRGNIYRKLGKTRLALNDYLEAMEINPESPAATAYKMEIKILDFYNKDMYNQ